MLHHAETLPHDAAGPARGPAVDGPATGTDGLFRAGFEGAAVGLAHLTETGAFVRVNPKLCAMTGYGADEMVGRRFVDFMPPGDFGPADWARRTRLFREGGSYAVDRRYVRKDGEILWFHIVTTLLRDAESGARHGMSVFEDITARKHAELRSARLNRLHAVVSKVSEAALRSRAPRLLFELACRIAVESGGFAIALVVEIDPRAAHGLRRVASHRGAGAAGRGDEFEVAVTERGPLADALRLGRCAVSVPGDDDAADAAGALGARLGIEATACFGIHAGGVAIGGLVVAAGQADYFGADEIELLTAVANGLGLSAESHAAERRRRQADEQVRRQESLLASASQIAGVGSWDHDIASGRLEWSDETLRIFGIAREEFDGTGAAWLKRLHPEDAEAMRERIFGRSATHDGAAEMEYRIVRPDGEERILLDRGAAVCDERGRVTRRAGMVTDITERRRAEAQQHRHAERLAALVQAQRELVGTDATLEQLLDRAPGLALEVIDTSGAVFELIDGDELVCRSLAFAGIDAVGLRYPRAGSLSGEAVRLGRTLCCDDTEADPRIAAVLAHRFGMRSALATVVRDRDGPIGVLKLFAHEPSRFGPAEADSLELLAEALGTVIQRKRAEEDARDSLRRQAGVLRLLQDMAASDGDLQSMMDLLAERALELIGATGSVVVLVEGDEGVYRAAAGTPRSELGRRLPSDGTLIGLTVERETVLRCDDAETDPRVNRELCRRVGARSLLTAPLRVGGAVVGVLTVVSDRAHAFARRDADTLQILVEWLGVVMQRSAATEQLRLSETQYRLVFEASPLPMWVFDTATLRFLAVNDAAVARYGYSSDEFLAMTLKDFRPPSGRAQLDAYLDGGDPTGRIAGLRLHRTKGGELLDVEISSDRVRFAGRPARLVLAHDVTERKRAERQLRQTEAVLAIAGRVAHVAGWSYHRADRALLYTDEMCALHDLPPGSAVTAEQALAFYAPESRATMVEAVRRCVEDGTPYDLELEIVTAAGRRVGVRTIGEAVRDGAGAVVGLQGAVQDISEKRRAAEQVRALAARLTTTLESITDGFFALDPQWRFTHVNPETERLLQRPRDELMGRVIWDVFPDSPGGLFDRRFRAAVDAGQSVAFEACYPTPQHWVDVNAYPSEAGLAVYFRDVTERHRSQEQLRLLETCVAWMNDAVIVTDAATSEGSDGPRILFVNDAFVRCTGYARDEVLGRTPRLLQGSLTQRSELDRIADALKRGQPVRAELVNYRRNGEAFWVEMEIVPLRSATGKTTHFVAVQRDTTERWRAQDALRSLNETLEAKVVERTLELELTNAALASKEEEIRSVVEHMADCVVNFDDAGIVRSANPMVESIFGYAPRELLGRNVATLVPALEAVGDDAGAGPCTIADAFGPATREARGLHRDGRGIALEVAVSQFRIKGQRLWTAILRDIGERIGIMADLEAARYEAEQASRAKSSFVATMSHEIRTPMNGVIGMIDVLEQTDLAPDQAKMLGLARDSASSLMEIIEDILDFSKIEAGRIELERAPIALASIVERACGLVAGVAAGKGVDLSIRIDPRLPAAVWGDAVRLRQVLVNLLSNAIKFSSGRPCAGRVGVGVSVASRAGDGVGLELAVTDNGIGMDQATIARLFQPFAQADASTTRRYGGTGLGLVICRHLVEAMGGRIRVQSTPEVGSTFTIELPAVVAPHGPDAADAGRSARDAVARRFVAKPARRELILVAEDNPINRLVISEQLKLLGYAAQVVGSGREALACWRSGRFSLLLTDLQMPEMDGYDLTAAIRAEEGAGPRLPIIALTANALKDEARRCLAAGLDDYVTKPVPLAALEAVLEHWVRCAPPCALPAPGAAGAPADARVLAGLVGDDPAVLREFYVDFAANAAEAATTLARAVTGARLTEVGAAAHRLKGSARSVGAAVLGEICAGLEQAAADADRRAVEAGLPQLLAEVGRVRRWVDAHWAEPARAPGAEVS